ncbi:MAG: 3D domain-containing protein [Sarcina sp.]
MIKLNSYLLLGALVLNSLTISGVDTNQMMQDRWNIECDVDEEKELIGEFTITHYCGCRPCNGKWYGYPAKNGENLEEGYTIAVDPKIIPLNDWVEIEGYGSYKACDTGSKIKGNRIDVYVSDHDTALEMGIKRKVKVYKVVDK